MMMLAWLSLGSLLLALLLILFLVVTA